MANSNCITRLARLSDQELVHLYDDLARCRCTTQDENLLRIGEMDDVHAELVARGIDWTDPQYS